MNLWSNATATTARAVITNDDGSKPDGRCQIDEQCIRLLALHQPTASDLRFITTGLKITTDLERIGDNAVNICERALELNEEPQLKPYVDLPRMAEIAQSMVKDQPRRLHARRHRARPAASSSATTRSICSTTRSTASCSATWPRIRTTIGGATRLLFVSKYLERIADHATNIAEMVVFMVNGRTIRHMDKKQK